MKHKSEKTGEKKSSSKTSEFPELFKRILRRILGGLGALAILLVMLLLCRDFLIRKAVPLIVSKVTGVEVTLDEVETSLLKGTLRLGNLKIANPQGYDNPYLLQLEYLFIDVDLTTLLTKTRVIEMVRVSGIQAQGAIGENGKLNLAVLNEHVQKEFPPQVDSDKTEEKKKTVPSESTLLIRRLIVENSSAELREDHTDFFLRIPLDCEKSDLVFHQDDRSVAEKMNDFTALVQAWSDGALHAGGALIDAGKSIINQGTDAGKSFAAPVADFFKNTFSGATK